MLNITLQQMKNALEVYRAGSISQAAKNLFMNQPNLSKSIHDLERELGITLFIRTPKGILISKEGALFMEYAQAVFQKLEELELLLTKQKQTEVSFNISIPRASYITYAFTQFVSTIPDISQMKINYRETNHSEAIENLLSHDFDLGIVRYSQPFDTELEQLRSRTDLICRKIWTSAYVLIFSSHHPLAHASEIHLADLAEYTELIHGDETPVQTASEHDASRQIALYERGSQFDFLHNVPTTYMWVSPVPQEILTQHELVQRTCCDSQAAFCDVLITRKNYHFTSFSRSFLSILEQTRDEIAAQPLPN